MDARIRYTKMIIRDTLLKLIKEKEISKITVKEICEKAQINRATFYRYYNDQYDLLEKTEEELLDTLEKKIAREKDNSFQIIFRVVTNDIKERYELYSILFSQNGDEKFRNRLYSMAYSVNMQTVKRIFTGMSEKDQEYIYYYIAEGSNGILQKWIASGMQEPAEHIVNLCESMIEILNRCLPSLIKNSKNSY